MLVCAIALSSPNLVPDDEAGESEQQLLRVPQRGPHAGEEARHRAPALLRHGEEAPRVEAIRSHPDLLLEGPQDVVETTDCHLLQARRLLLRRLVDGSGPLRQVGGAFPEGRAARGMGSQMLIQKAALASALDLGSVTT